MRVIILAGGFGTRLGEVTDLVPKPMVSVGGKPIIVHLMEHFASYGHTQFHLALGYNCLLYTSPSPRDRQKSRMPSSA